MKAVGRVLPQLFSSLLCLLATELRAQDSASLTIFVSDPSSAVVPGARVSIVDSHRGTVTQAATGGSGRANFDSLAPSDYTIEVEKPGFNKSNRERKSCSSRKGRTAYSVAGRGRQRDQGGRGGQNRLAYDGSHPRNTHRS